MRQTSAWTNKKEALASDIEQKAVPEGSLVECDSETLQGKFDELKAQRTRRRPPSERQRRPRGPPSASWRSTSPGGTAA